MSNDGTYACAFLSVKIMDKILTEIGTTADIFPQYLARNNTALKILFFKQLRSLALITPTAPWYSQAQPKPMYENDQVAAYWNIPLFADTTHVKVNRIDAKIIDKGCVFTRPIN